MGLADKKGITVASGFDLSATALLDTRGSAQTLEERNALVTNNAAAPGLDTFVYETGTKYLWDGSSWVPYLTGTMYEHPTTSGNRHIPSGGQAGQILRWSADGTAVWGEDNDTTYSTGTASVSGLTKLYTSTGSSTDGSMTQQAITSALGTKADSSHTHTVSNITDFPTSLKNPNTIQIKLNGGTTEGTNLFSYDGSAEKVVNITASGIGAASSSHTHNYAASSTAGGVALNALKDNAGQQIDSTYIKNISISGTTVTITKGDDTTSTVTTQDTNTTYSAATTSAAGLMSASDKTKLDGIAAGATNVTVDTELSTTENGHAIANSTVTTALAGKASTSHTHNYAASSSAGGAATTAIGDSTGQEITTTYIKGISISGTTVTITKGDGTTSTVKTQDTNTTYSVMGAASSSAAGTSGLVPAPAAGKQSSFLRGDGTWVVPTNTTYSAATTSAAGLMSAADKTKLDGIDTGATKITVDTALSTTSTNPVTNAVVTAAINGKAASSHTHNYAASSSAGGSATTAIGDSAGQQINTTYIKSISISGTTVTITKGDGTTSTATTQDTNTTYSTMTAATSSAAGTSGLVPAPAAGKQASFLRGDGTWVVPTNTTYSDATTSAAGLMSASDKTKLDGIATGATKITVDTALSTTSTNPVTNAVITAAINDKASSSHTHNYAASSSAGGAATTAIGDSTGQQINSTYIKGISISGTTITITRGDDTTSTVTTQDTNTTYSVMTAATSSAAGTSGLVPAPAAGKQASFLRGDGTWVVPTNTTYSAATTSADGLMSAADKTRLDGLPDIEMVSTLPTSVTVDTYFLLIEEEEEETA